MFGSAIFGAGYFAGAQGIVVLPALNPATPDVICLVHGDVGVILIRPDVGMILIRSDASEVDL